MDFDLSKLDTVHNKLGGAKAKPRFGPAARARPKPQAKPVEPPACLVLHTEQQPQGDSAGDSAALQPSAHSTFDERQATAASEPAAAAVNNEAIIAAAPAPPAPVEKLGRRFKPTAGKRKLAEDQEPSSIPEPSHDAAVKGKMAVVPADAAGEEPAAATGPSTGPMTKAKKRKGMGKGGGSEACKTRTPLAEQTIDPHTMPMKTIIKCAMAKDRVKASAEQAARAAAAVGQGSASRQPPSRGPQAQPETVGAPQMILDEETGQLVLDRASLTIQAQPREEYTRREEGQHDTINSQSYMKRENTARWSPEETEEFYAALQIWGTNFNYMATRINTRMAAMGLPSNNRSHRQVKLKYKREEKAHPKKVTAAINGQRAENEDYIEMIHELQAAQNEVQQDESTYLEAAPRDAAEGAQPMGGEANPLPYGSAFDPVYKSDCGPEADVLTDQAELQAGTHTDILTASGAPSRGRPRVRPQGRANKAAQQRAPLVEGQIATGEPHLLQQQEATVAAEASDRFTRMLQDSGVSAEDLEAGY